MKFDIKDKGLRDVGVKRIEWANMAMPVLESIRKRFEKDRPLGQWRDMVQDFYEIKLTL